MNLLLMALIGIWTIINIMIALNASKINRNILLYGRKFFQVPREAWPDCNRAFALINISFSLILIPAYLFIPWLSDYVFSFPIAVTIYLFGNSFGGSIYARVKLQKLSRTQPIPLEAGPPIPIKPITLPKKYSIVTLTSPLPTLVVTAIFALFFYQLPPGFYSSLTVSFYVPLALMIPFLSLILTLVGRIDPMSHTGWLSPWLKSTNALRRYFKRMFILSYAILPLCASLELVGRIISLSLPPIPPPITSTPIFHSLPLVLFVFLIWGEFNTKQPIPPQT